MYLQTFLISYFVLQDAEKILQVLSKLTKASLIKIVYISDEKKVVYLPSQRGVVGPFINPEVYLLDILDTTSRLNTSHGIETLYVRSSRHDGIIK